MDTIIDANKHFTRLIVAGAKFPTIYLLQNGPTSPYYLPKTRARVQQDTGVFESNGKIARAVYQHKLMAKQNYSYVLKEYVIKIIFGSWGRTSKNKF